MQSRAVTGHEINEFNQHLEIRADEPGPGNASHEYTVQLKNQQGGVSGAQHIRFQEGPVSEHGVNGVSNEALLAIVADRLRGFQSGQYSCRENALALTKIEEALHWLHQRTKERVKRGVEGTSAR